MTEIDVVDVLASELGVLPETRKKWRFRGHVPHRWRLPILAEAKRRRIPVDPDLFDDYRPTMNARRPRAARAEARA